MANGYHTFTYNDLRQFMEIKPPSCKDVDLHHWDLLTGKCDHCGANLITLDPPQPEKERIMDAYEQLQAEYIQKQRMKIAFHRWYQTHIDTMEIRRLCSKMEPGRVYGDQHKGSPILAKLSAVFS